MNVVCLVFIVKVFNLRQDNEKTATVKTIVLCKGRPPALITFSVFYPWNILTYG